MNPERSKSGIIEDVVKKATASTALPGLFLTDKTWKGQIYILMQSTPQKVHPKRQQTNCKLEYKSSESEISKVRIKQKYL